MRYLLDTSAVSQLVRETPAAISRLSSLAESDEFLINAIVRGELIYGIDRLPRGSKRDLLEKKLKLVLSSLVCEPVTPAIADAYAALKIAQQNKGLSLDENDLWIAATAQHYQATLVAGDRDFESIDGITIEFWIP